jgi:hypothetical protein
MDEPEPEVEARGPKKKERDRDRGYAGVAMRELRRARRALEQAADPAVVPAEAAASLQIANALALLDLAAAVRGRSGMEQEPIEE